MNMQLKKYSVVLLVPIVFLLTSCYSIKKKDGMEQSDVATINPQAELDFKYIDSLKAHFCDYPKECEQYENYNFLEKRKFEEKVSKNKMRLALNFLNTYPDDPRYFEVLKFFLNLSFEPRFLMEKISDSLMVVLSKDVPPKTPEYYHQVRSLPIDHEAKSKWLKEGYEFAEKFIQSNAAVDKKIVIEVAVDARDFRQAFELYNMLYKEKKGMEATYWEQFDEYYWEPFLIRMIDLVKKYPESEKMAIYVEQLIALVSSFSPNLAKPYWETFLKLTSIDQPSFNFKGFEAIHIMAKENLKALKSLGNSKPLDMAFTAIDGTKINLVDLRGKVVLIDFWTIGCAPCIKEMPHVQALYDKYRNKGFEVIGLAADSDKAKKRVLEIIKRQGATWPQYLDKGKNVIVSYHTLHNIQSYPTVWLLNKDGIVVDRNARGKRLEPLIRKYLELDN